MAKWRKPGSGLVTILKATGTIVVLVASAILLFSPAATYESYLSFRIQKLIRTSESQVRSATGRLSGAPYAEFTGSTLVPEEMGRAQLLVLSLSHSPRRDYLQSQIDLGTRNWSRAAETLTKLAAEKGADPAIINDLGVAFLQLAEQDAVYLFKAMAQFELAEKRAPRAPEPRFNSLQVLRRLQLVQKKDRELAEYTQIEKSGLWHDELLKQPVMEEERVAAELQAAVDRHDDGAAQTIFSKWPEICRKIAMAYAMNPHGAMESERLAVFVAAALKNRYGDETVSSMLSSLDRGDPSTLIEARRLVAEGASYYFEGDLHQSRESYKKAARLIENRDSVFDKVWINVNKADTDIRLNDIEEARRALDPAVKLARAANLKWLLAYALVPYASHRGLNSTFGEMLDHIEEVIRICQDLQAPKASVRAKFYLSGLRFNLGDLDGALRLAVECLKLAEPTDHIRLANLYTYVGSILYKKGFIEQSVSVGDESVNQAIATGNPSLILATSTARAAIGELSGQPESADAYLMRSEAAIKGIIEEIEHIRAEVLLNNARARIVLNRGKSQDAEELLENSLPFFDPLYKLPIYVRAETLMLLGQTYAAGNKVKQASEVFQHGIDIAEEDNNYVKSARMAFDDSRRELYDSAIGFEHAHGATDQAWTYLQRYQAKLFIEILAQFNPEIEKIHSIALNRNEVQKAIPHDLQVVEYAVLPDRLLIWVIADNRFETRSVPIKRADLEQQVQDFLGDLREIKPVSDESTALYKSLIAPIAGSLDPNRTLAIIPDRALHGLPFAALKSPDSGYLVEHYSIVVSPTLTHFLAVNKTPIKRDVIVTFGSRTGEVADTREISSVQSFYRSGTSYLGAQVTKASFLDAMERAPVFHYAGHSAHDAADSIRSAILLDGDKSGPNSVTAGDIVTHKLLPNALVVLSSCDSSVGNSKDGIGIRGLTSAFLIGGAGAVVGSLWPVESTSTAELMIDFHKSFAGDRMPVVQALRKAQLAFITGPPRRSHPYYWSGFVVTGNYSALR